MMNRTPVPSAQNLPMTGFSGVGRHLSGLRYMP
jgi:hypothetical protein